jgi:hypothetical protein
MDPKVKPKALVVVEFGPGVTPEQAEEFHRHLAAQRWERVPELARAWRATFSQGAPLDVAVSISKEDVSVAAQRAHIRHHDYRAAVMPGPLLPTKF